MTALIDIRVDFGTNEIDQFVAFLNESQDIDAEASNDSHNHVDGHDTMHRYPEAEAADELVQSLWTAYCEEKPNAIETAVARYRERIAEIEASADEDEDA